MVFCVQYRLYIVAACRAVKQNVCFIADRKVKNITFDRKKLESFFKDSADCAEASTGRS